MVDRVRHGRHRLRRVTDSVRVRVTLLATVLTAAVLVVGASVLTRAVERRLVEDRTEATSLAVGMTALRFEQALPAGAQPAPAVTTGAQAVPVGGNVVQVAGQVTQPRSQGMPAGAEFFPIAAEVTPIPGVATMVLDRATLQPVDGSSLPAGFSFSQPVAGRSVRVLNTPAGFGEVAVDSRVISLPQQDFLVVGVSSLAEVRRSVATLWSNLRIGIPFVVAAVALVAWLLAGRALRPVEVMRRQVEAMPGSAPAAAVARLREPVSHDEVARLARTMNSLLDRVDDARRHERQFISDASHELRSPLASIRAQVEADEVLDRDALRAESARLAAIVDGLMDLAKADEGTAPALTEVDLDEVVLEEVGLVARTTRVSIDTCRVGAARLHGDPAAISRLVRNLLDNAARHATRRVEVSVSSSDGRVCLHIDDDGPGVPEEERAGVFDRFARLDASRSRDTGGVGLGLAVVRATAVRHGGSVCCLSSPLGGARFEVTLPLAGA